MSDTDKICMQLFLDIQVCLFLSKVDVCELLIANYDYCQVFLEQEYGRNLSVLGVEAADIPAYCSLWQCVAPPDRQNVIKF